MEELFKLAASGAGFAGLLVIYYLVRLEPRFRAVEEAILLQSKVDLLRLAASPLVATELKEAATKMIQDTDTRLSKLK